MFMMEMQMAFAHNKNVILRGNNMKLFYNNKEITLEELKYQLDNEVETIELFEIDDNGNLYFEKVIYGQFY